MYQRESEPIETIHLYVVPECDSLQSRMPLTLPRIINSVLFSLFMAFLLTLPSDRDISPKTIRVPLQFLPLQTLFTTVEISPTGKNTISATNAHGFLTVYNGSILVQQIPRGFIVTSQDGAEMITDEAATIPAGNPPAYGIASIQAHAVVAGSAGNIAALSINETYGTSLYLKNLTAFRGGNDAYTVMFATDTDRLTSLTTARSKLNTEAKNYQALLDKPCNEAATQDDLSLTVSWTCQFVRYQVPKGLHILSVQRQGEFVLLQVASF
jgi:hypothetical protein